MSVAFLEKHALELEDIQEKMSKMSKKKGKHGRHIGIVVISPSRIMFFFEIWDFCAKNDGRFGIDKFTVN